MKSVAGKTALITGASRGIGPYIARTLAQAGMNLVLVARTAAAVETVAADMRAHDVSAIGLTADISRRDQLETLVERAEAESGGIDVLVNNAGLDIAYPYHKLSPEIISEILAVNLTAPMLLSRLFLPHMIARGQGHIVNIASLSGLVGTPYSEVYAASKHGMVGFTRSLRLTAVGENYPVGASVICPGFISEAGMYSDTSQAAGLEAPGIFGTSPPEKVAQAVLTAILNDQPEVIVNSKPFRPMLLTQVLAPSWAAWFARKTGGLDLFRGFSRHIEAEMSRED